MVIDSLTAVRLIEGLRLIVGFILIYIALKAYGRTKQKAMFILAVSFVLLTTAGMAEGILYEVFSYEILSAQAVRSAIALAGLIGILFATRKIT